MIQIRVQGTDNPTTKILTIDESTADQVGMLAPDHCSGIITNLIFKVIVSTLIFWTYVEIGVGFIVACLPPSRRSLDQVSLQAILRKVRSISAIHSKLWSRESSSDEVKGGLDHAC